MKKLNNSLSKTNIVIYISYFLIGLIVFSWFNSNQILLSGDFAWPLDFKKFFYLTNYIWDDSVNFGYQATRQLASISYSLYGLLFENIFGNTFTQHLFLYFSLIFSGVGTYLLLIQFRIGKLSAYISSFLYMFSPYALSSAWDVSQGANVFYFAFLPFGIYIMLSSLNKTYIDVIKASILLLLLPISFTFSNPVYFLMFIVTLSTVAFIYYFMLEDKKIIINYSIFTTFYIVLNSYWLLPFILSLGLEFSQSTNQAIGISDFYNLKLNSIDIYNAFNGSGVWIIFTTFMNDTYHDYSKLYFDGLFKFILFIPVIIALSLYSFIKNKKLYLISMTLFLISIFVLSALKTEGILYEIWIWMFGVDNYFSRAFRNLYGKFGSVHTLLIVFLVAISIDWLKNSKKSILYLLTILLLILYITFQAKPFFNGSIYRGEANAIPSEIVNIPNEYNELSLLLKNDNNSSDLKRIITLPFPKSYNHMFEWGKDSGFLGAEFAKWYLSKYDSLIYINFLNNFSERLPLLIKYNNKKEFIEFFQEFNIKGVVFHKDIFNDSIVKNNYLIMPKSETISYLLSSDFDLKIDNKFFSYYLLKDELFVPRIVVETKNIISYPTYKKINPTRYEVKVSDIGKDTLIKLSDKFSPMWKIYIKNNNKESSTMNSLFGYLFEEKRELKALHYTTNENNNIWNLSENIQGEFKIVIEYSAQKIVIISRLITIFLFLFAILLLIYNKLSNFNQKVKRI